MMKRKILYLYMVLFGMNVYGQTDFRSGYILKNNGDTVGGLIDYRGNVRNSKVCTFKPDKTGMIHRYKPFEIAAYRYRNDRYYVSKMVRSGDEKKACFAEFLVRGKKNLYYLRDDSGDHFLIDSRNDTLRDLPYHEEIVMQKGIKYLKKPQKHINLLKGYFIDSPGLFKSIDRIDQLNAYKLVKTTSEYNSMKGHDSAFMVYFNPKPVINLSIELRIGLLNYYRGNTAAEYGGLAYLWLPRSNERLYFKTGLLFSEPKILDINYRIIKIPFQLEYLFPDKRVRPRIDLGINYCNANGGAEAGNGPFYTMAGDAGFLIRIAKNLYLGCNAGFELATSFNPISQNLKLEPFSYALNTGLYLKLQNIRSVISFP
jgi:hypothetical protein